MKGQMRRPMLMSAALSMASSFGSYNMPTHGKPMGFANALRFGPTVGKRYKREIKISEMKGGASFSRKCTGHHRARKAARKRSRK